MGKRHSESPFGTAQRRERFQQTARMSAAGSWWMMGGRREAERSGRRFRLSSQQFNGRNTCMSMERLRSVWTKSTLGIQTHHREGAAEHHWERTVNK